MFAARLNCSIKLSGRKVYKLYLEDLNLKNSCQLEERFLLIFLLVWLELCLIPVRINGQLWEELLSVFVPEEDSPTLHTTRTVIRNNWHFLQPHSEFWKSSQSSLPTSSQGAPAEDSRSICSKFRSQNFQFMELFLTWIGNSSSNLWTGL